MGDVQSVGKEVIHDDDDVPEADGSRSKNDVRGDLIHSCTRR